MLVTVPSWRALYTMLTNGSGSPVLSSSTRPEILWACAGKAKNNAHPVMNNLIMRLIFEFVELMKGVLQLLVIFPVKVLKSQVKNKGKNSDENTEDEKHDNDNQGDK